MPSVVAAAGERGLEFCPAITGPYLRLAWLDQPSAPDSAMSKGSAPSASVTIASGPVRADHEYPKGFYLRVVGGVRWLRGYRSDDEHVWSPHDVLAFARWGGTNRAIIAG